MHHAFPCRFTLECLAYRNRLDQRRRAAVHVLDGFFELVGFTHTSAFNQLLPSACWPIDSLATATARDGALAEDKPHRRPHNRQSGQNGNEHPTIVAIAMGLFQSFLPL